MPSWSVFSLTAPPAHVTVAIRKGPDARRVLGAFAESRELADVLAREGVRGPGHASWRAGDRVRGIPRTVDDWGLAQDLLVVPHLYVLDDEGRVVRASRDEVVPARIAREERS